jgi:hypothetical protein
MLAIDEQALGVVPKWIKPYGRATPAPTAVSLDDERAACLAKGHLRLRQCPRNRMRKMYVLGDVKPKSVTHRDM